MVDRNGINTFNLKYVYTSGVSLYSLEAIRTNFVGQAGERTTV